MSVFYNLDVHYWMTAPRVLYKKSEIISLLIIVLLSRLPFLFHGFGVDADAWWIVQSGLNLYSKGVYRPSRFPGYPLPEFTAGALWVTKLPFIIPWIFNLITAVLSVIAVYYFILISGRFINKIRYIVYLSALVFAFSPLFYINSTGMMDYNWALAFLMGAVYYLLSERLNLSALFLAFAVGCRITSALIIIPFIYLMLMDKRLLRRDIMKYIIISSAAAFILLLPLILKYGVTFLTYDRPKDAYSIMNIVGRLTLRAWGAVGSIGIVAAVISQFVIDKKNFIRKLIVKEKTVNFVLITIIVFFLLFLSLPVDAGYLIPLIPFVVLVLYRFLSPKILLYLSVILIASPFILYIDQNDVFLAGPVLTDSNKRIAEEKYVNKVIDKAETFNRPGLIICQAFLPKIEITMKLKNQTVPEDVMLVYTLSYDSLKTLVQNNNPDIFYLKNVRENTIIIYNYDLEMVGARKIEED